MKRATDLAHLLMRQTVKTGDWTVDATIGNGHDTLFLANLVGRSGRVFGFDVQEMAVTETARRSGGLPQVRLVHSGHERLAEHLSENEPANGSENGEIRLAGVMFNLGYLPGGPRDITTRAETTIAGLKQQPCDLMFKVWAATLPSATVPGSMPRAGRRNCWPLNASVRIERHRPLWGYDIAHFGLPLRELPKIRAPQAIADKVHVSGLSISTAISVRWAECRQDRQKTRRRRRASRLGGQ